MPRVLKITEHHHIYNEIDRYIGRIAFSHNSNTWMFIGDGYKKLSSSVMHIILAKIDALNMRDNVNSEGIPGDIEEL